MPKTTITATSYTREDGIEQKQYRITVPKGIAEALDLTHGEKVDWEIESANAVTIRRAD